MSHEARAIENERFFYKDNVHINLLRYCFLVPNNIVVLIYCITSWHRVGPSSKFEVIIEVLVEIKVVFEVGAQRLYW